MILQLKYFGMIAEAVEKEDEFFELSGSTIKELDVALKNCYSNIENLNYSFAVNQTMVNEDILLKENDEVALLPPFAGG